MSQTIRLAGLCCLILSTASLAVAPPPRPLGPVEIQRLIEQLGDRDYRIREQAERRLTVEGLPALPLLRKAMGHRDPEIRRRALRLVPGLEHAALVSPRRVTLKVENKPLNVVFEELSKKSGYKILNAGTGMAFMPVPVAVPAVAVKGPAGVVAPRETTYSYDFVNVPFWDVVDRICRDANLVVQQSWGDESVRLYQSGSYSPHTGRDGAFRYSATNLQLYRNIDLSSMPRGGASPTRNETLTFNVTLFAEPRLPFLGMGEVRLDAAYDSEKNSMLPPSANNDASAEFGGPWGGMRIGRRYYGGGYKQMSMQVGLSLNRVSEKASTIKLVRGVVPVTVLVEQRPITITEKFLAAKGTKTRAGDLEFHVDTVQKMPNNQYQVKFTATYKGTVTDYNWMNNIYQRLELQDEKGNKYQQWGSNWHGGGGNNVTLTLTYSGMNMGKIGAPTKFVYLQWLTRQHDVHFEFKDVPLP